MNSFKTFPSKLGIGTPFLLFFAVVFSNVTTRAVSYSASSALATANKHRERPQANTTAKTTEIQRNHGHHTRPILPRLDLPSQPYAAIAAWGDHRRRPARQYYSAGAAT